MSRNITESVPVELENINECSATARLTVHVGITAAREPGRTKFLAISSGMFASNTFDTLTYHPELHEAQLDTDFTRILVKSGIILQEHW